VCAIHVRLDPVVHHVFDVLLDTITVHPFVICEAIVDYLWPINYLVHALLLSDALACYSKL
jgi:hypothetical protein